MAISIDGKPATGAWVSLTALNEATPGKVQRAPGVAPLFDKGEHWLPVDQPAVQRLLGRNKPLDDAALYTRKGAASELGVRKRDVNQATAGLRALFRAGNEPAYDLQAVRGALPANVKKAGPIAATGRMARAVVPLAAGAVGTAYIGAQLARSAGGMFETKGDTEARRTGALLGAGGVAVAGGVVSRAFKEMPIVVNAGRGVALGGLAVGALALGVANSTETADGEN